MLPFHLGEGGDATMKAAMVEVLIVLARIDGEWRQIHDRLDAIPTRIARIDTEAARLKSEQERAQRELDEAMKKRRQREQDALALDAQIASDAGKLASIRNNVEYQAMLKQIAEGKNKKTALENDALELMEREEALGRKLREDRKHVDQELAELTQDRAALDAERKQNEAELAAKTEERSQLLAGLDPELRSRYQRLARAKGGLAVVPVVNGACGGCFTALPPQRVNEARLAERLVFCDGCSRILIWDEERGSL